MDAEIKALNTRFDDELLRRKRENTSLVQSFQGIPLPSIIEISESGVCNRKCSFCPRSAPSFVERNEFISPELVNRLAEQLSALNYSGLILFSGFVEPLLDKRICDHLFTLREQLPDCRLEMVTNGDPLTVVNFNKLAASGLDTLLVSCYDGPHQITQITNMLEYSNFPRNKVVFRSRWAGADENFNISLSNRGGMMQDAEFSIKPLQKPWGKPCFYPANTFFIDYQGDVLMCAHDWGKKAVAGNLFDEEFMEIWTGLNFSSWRKSLLAGNRQISPCDVCNVDGTRMGDAHAKAWGDYYAKKGLT